MTWQPWENAHKQAQIIRDLRNARESDPSSPAKAQSEVERLLTDVRNRLERAQMGVWASWIDDVLRRLAALPSEEQIRADERERCAKVAEQVARHHGTCERESGGQCLAEVAVACGGIVSAIRAIR